MPMRVETLTAARDLVHGTDGFVGPVEHTVAVPVLLTAMTNKEIDSDGYLKPYIPLLKTGAPVTAGAVFGVTVEHIRVANDNIAGTIAALGTIDVAVATVAQLNRAIAEDVLDRAYTAAELTGFAAAGCHVVLL
jgi:hypothetical protein